MTYGNIIVKCPRCDSVIEIMSSNLPAEIFQCPVCAEGEIHHDSNQPALQTVSVYAQNPQRLEQYITTLSNIWTN